MSETTLFDERTEEKPQRRRAKAVAKEPEGRPALPAVQPTSVLEVIARIAADPNVNTDKMRAVIEIQRETESKQQFHDAMVAMDAELPRINRDGKIVLKGGGVLRFASFENINKVLKPILRKHGFRMTYEPDVPASGQGIIVHCHLTRGLYRESCTVPVSTAQASPAMNAQQATGAAISYAKRYGTIALVNLETEAPEDRDTDATPEVKTINGSQAKKLQEAIGKNGVPDAVFKKYWLDPFGIEAVHQLPAKEFDNAMQACEKYGKKAKAK